MLVHINTVKALANQLRYIKVNITDEDVYMVLIMNLPPSFDNLITSLESMSTKDVDLQFIVARLLHEVSKRKECESSETTASVNKTHKSNEKLCFYCKKPGHFVRNCLRKKSDEKEKANQACEDHEQVFVAAYVTEDHEQVFVATTYDWIVDSGATQHMTFEQEWFTMYKHISPRRVFMGDDTVLEAIGKGSIKATMQVGGHLKHTTIAQVLNVPKMKNNLISVNKLISKGFKVEFDKDGCNVATPLWPSVGVKPNTWKSWRFGALRDFRMFKARQQGPKHLSLGVLGVIEKFLKRRYRKWPRIGHSDIYSPSYGQKKGRESNWQFDSRPLKVGNRPLPDVRIESATRRWKALDESYNFDLGLVPIRVRGEELWLFKVLGV